MQIRLVRNLTRIALIGAIFASLQACTSLPSNDNGVAEAYRTSGAVAVSPYSRTIFSSSNF